MVVSTSRPGRGGLPGTYSIVARDPSSGELGVAVQSHWFSVGPIVPWARTGVGVVATQANAEVSYGPRALELMAAGAPAADALAALLAADSGAASRQVAIVDAQGRAAAHTGASCVPCAGHTIAEAVSCQGNMLSTEEVWPAMQAAFARSEGSLAERLLSALEAGERAGGDARGRQSAAILVVPSAGEAWEALVSLRVEDHPRPLDELGRLLVLHRAYALAGEADGLIAEGRHAEAAALYQRASALAPGNYELRFWAGLGIAQGGDLDGGVAYVREVIAAEPRWAVMLSRLPPEMAPAAALVARRLGVGDARR